MKKLKQAEEKEKKQEREDQKSRYQEALPSSFATVNIIKSTFKVEYLPGITPGIVNRSSSIFQPPRV